MSDQASTLRGLMEQRRQAVAPGQRSVPCAHARSLAFLSGKGGVGKTNLALNTAIALRQQGRRVCLWDLSGLANLDLLCGLNGYWDYSHVMSGAKRLGEVLLEGPSGIQVLPGLNVLSGLSELHADARMSLLRELESLERDFDDLVLDLPTGLSELTCRAALGVDRAILVTTPEPTSIADSYATVKTLLRRGESALSLLVNQVQSAEQAFEVIDRIQQTSRMFLQFELGVAGYVPTDANVARAVLRRRPLILENPHAPASEAIAGWSQRMAGDDASTRSLVSKMFPEAHKHEPISPEEKSASGPRTM